MSEDICGIHLPLPFGMGKVNCYLIYTANGFFLFDTGGPNNRKELLSVLHEKGCDPGQLHLIILTHGDFDHTGNAAYLRKAYRSRIAMHVNDLGMAKEGDMFYNRSKPNILLRKLIPVFSGFGKDEKFIPDLLLEDGTDLSRYGLNGLVISIPGHSKGSIGILMESGAFFCGDLLENTHSPALGSIMDDKAEAKRSLQKLCKMKIDTIYPGHGKPFPMQLDKEPFLSSFVPSN